jgi:hypothetical protein
MKLYKLIEQNWTTYEGKMGWEIGRTNSTPKRENPKLCSPDVIHAYENLNLGLLLNPIHANIDKPIILECDGKICVKDFGKCGVFELNPIKQLNLPNWYTDEDKKKDIQILFSIFCAESVLSIWNNYDPKDDRVKKAIKIR